MPSTLYSTVKSLLLALDADTRPLLDWARGLQNDHLPLTPEILAGEAIWVILCAGRSAQAARTLEHRVVSALLENRPVLSVFGYAAKAAAIDSIWANRTSLLEAFLAIRKTGNIEALLEWCDSLPFVGPDTKFQLAKNLGVPTCKLDIWLCRLAGIPDSPRLPLALRYPACQALCEALSKAAGDSVATVDSLLWLACNKGLIQVSPAAGPVTLSTLDLPKRKTIF